MSCYKLLEEGVTWLFLLPSRPEIVYSPFERNEETITRFHSGVIEFRLRQARIFHIVNTAKQADEVQKRDPKEYFSVQRLFRRLNFTTEQIIY